MEKLKYCPHELPPRRWRLWREDWLHDQFILVENENFMVFSSICASLGIELELEEDVECGNG